MNLTDQVSRIDGNLKSLKDNATGRFKIASILADLRDPLTYFFFNRIEFYTSEFDE